MATKLSPIGDVQIVLKDLRELQDTPEKAKGKIGDIGGHAPCCTTIKYAILNTVDYGWTNSTLQRKFCDHSLSMSTSSDMVSRSIKDTIVLTHSMGGLAMAGALANDECSFGENSLWVSMSAPMVGSMVGDYVQDVCGDDTPRIVTKVLEWVGQCPPSAARKSISYQNGKYSTPKLNAAYAAAQEAYRGNVSAAMCSKNYHGVLSQYQVQSIVEGNVFPHKSRKNDGLVEFQSCLGGLPEESFGSSYLDRSYAPDLNHADTAFLTHDGFFKDSQKPFNWLECLFGNE
ncbi:unnamed protein product [Phytophthora fragariaefolia]|uniref:Unnamed protein product n=1 Tax=Phytophthora fragariaefolia TaxID=1490495 RepID=A0A9W6XXJ8_9STRA|nr:unnamed protein product [Phytophthora fragariaefolia]